jgi:hypothetical protein
VGGRNASFEGESGEDGLGKLGKQVARRDAQEDLGHVAVLSSSLPTNCMETACKLDFEKYEENITAQSKKMFTKALETKLRKEAFSFRGKKKNANLQLQPFRMQPEPSQPFFSTLIIDF